MSTTRCLQIPIPSCVWILICNAVIPRRKVIFILSFNIMIFSWSRLRENGLNFNSNETLLTDISVQCRCYQPLLFVYLGKRRYKFVDGQCQQQLFVISSFPHLRGWDESGKNWNVPHKAQPSVTYELLLKRPTATIICLNIYNRDANEKSVLQLNISKNSSKWVWFILLYKAMVEYSECLSGV